MKSNGWVKMGGDGEKKVRGKRKRVGKKGDRNGG